MPLLKSYNETLKVSYPASKNGGTMNQTVRIDVFLKNEEFNTSVDHCNQSVNLLTGSIVATEAAQVEIIEENSQKIASSLVRGIFGYIHSEISQQIAELSQSVDAQILHLRELGQACLGKRSQMESDFKRIASRYVKIFQDLNTELHNRIYELDKPTFLFKHQLDHLQQRSFENDLVNTITVFGKENTTLISSISTSIAKKTVLDSIHNAQAYLFGQKQLKQTLSQNMHIAQENVVYYLPVCIIHKRVQGNPYQTEAFSASVFSKHAYGNMNDSILRMISGKPIKEYSFTKEEQSIMMRTFDGKVIGTYPQQDAHSDRVKAIIYSMAKKDNILDITVNQ